MARATATIKGKVSSPAAILRKSRPWNHHINYSLHSQSPNLLGVLSSWPIQPVRGSLLRKLAPQRPSASNIVTLNSQTPISGPIAHTIAPKPNYCPNRPTHHTHHNNNSNPLLHQQLHRLPQHHSHDPSLPEHESIRIPHRTASTDTTGLLADGILDEYDW